MADLWHRHTIDNLLCYAEMLDWHEEMRVRESEEKS
jgi:hypothetical protein